MLRANGLVNGSSGHVHHIAYLSRRTSGPPPYQHVALLAVMLESTSLLVQLRVHPCVDEMLLTSKFVGDRRCHYFHSTVSILIIGSMYDPTVK